MQINSSAAEVVDWISDFECYFLFEAPTEQLLPFLPKKMVATEIRPGIGLLGVGLIHFTKDNIVSDAAFTEMTCSIAVQKDLSKIGNAIPKFAFKPVAISSDSIEFLKQASSVDYMPTCTYESTCGNIGSDFLSGVFSTNGESVLEVELNTLPQKQRFSKENYQFQLFTEADAFIYYANVAWSGLVYETQQKSLIKHLNINTSHNFFKGIDIDCSLSNLYMFMMAFPGEPHIISYSSPQKWRPL